MKQTSLTLPSFAKINWNLQILGKRPDGYHEVRTILQTISLSDEIHFELIEDQGVSLSCNDHEVPTDATNLVTRAALVLMNRYQVDKGVDIKLEKRIPTQAGLGGASSNAAVTLLALAHLWDITATEKDLFEIAARLGSDVPFFLIGGSALATGTGTEVSPLRDAEEKHLIVVAPNAKVSTAKAYSALRSTALTTSNSVPILSSSPEGPNFSDSSPSELPKQLINDFEQVIFDIEPEIRRAKDSLIHAGARAALMAGSGSSVFGIFADRKAQERALNEIKSEAGWRIFPCDTVSRRNYFLALDFPGSALARSFNSESDFGA